MSIVSLEFLLFCAVLLLVYYKLCKTGRWKVLLAASMLFYILGGWKTCAFLLITIVTQWFAARQMEKANAEFRRLAEEQGWSGKEKIERRKAYNARKKKWLEAAIVINFGLLCAVKYTNFAIENVNALLLTVGKSRQFDAVQMLVPLGISFYTFASTGYVIDVYRGRVRAEQNIFRFALFVSYFPVIVQGPICRYEEVKEQLYAQRPFDAAVLKSGLQRMLLGYFKKMVIADRIAILSTEIMTNYAAKGYTGFLIFIGVFLSGVKVYADFSGGMDIVLGLSESLGTALPENFRRPYMARSVAEFWQRWHMTLGAWMKNYVFYPLSLSKPFAALGKKCRKELGSKGKVVAPSLASLIVFLLVGVWHGADWTYVCYGFYMAVFVSTGTLLEDFYKSMRRRFHIQEEKKSWALFQILRTNFVITIGKYFSVAASMADWKGLVKATLAEVNPWIFFDGTFYTLGLNQKNFSLMLLLIALLFAMGYAKEKGVCFRASIARQNIAIRWGIYYAAIFAIIILGIYGQGYEASAFVYQQF